MSNDIPYRSAVGLAKDIRDGELSSLEVVDKFYSRIDERNGEINAFVTLIEEEARERAKELDRMLDDGEEVGALHGVPIALKDVFGFKQGVRHTFGSVPMKDFVPDEDSAFVERLEREGAVVLGKTNTPEFGHSATTDNNLFGATGNPFDPEKMAGGSSGGSAAAVADGLVPWAQGSDSAGSIRIPASACGVYGLKPTFGRVPLGVGPDAFAAHTPYTHIGPLTRHVEDAALMMEVMAGPYPSPEVLPDDGTDYVGATEMAVEDLSMAVSPDLDLFPVDEKVRDVFDDSVDSYARFMDVEEVDFPLGRSLQEVEYGLLRMFTVSLRRFVELAGEEHGVDMVEDRFSDLTSSLQQLVRTAEDFDALEYKRADEVRTDVYVAVEEVLDEHEVLLTPTLFVPPFSNDIPGPSEVNGESVNPYLGWFATWIFNMTGHPVASIPMGFVDGLPVGMQVVGRKFRDDEVLAVSAEYERREPWHDAYPPRRH